MNLKQLAVILAVFLTRTSSQSADIRDNKITNFCRRFAAQSTVIDNRLYLDGGFINYGGRVEANTANVTNPYLIYSDLDWADNGFPVQYTNLSKPSSVPTVVGGALWADEVNKKFYLFGGEYDSTQSQPSTRGFYAFDTVDEKWSEIQLDRSYSEKAIAQPSFGASAVDPNRGRAYFYGGWKSNGIEADYNGTDREATSDMVYYDFDEDIWYKDSFYDVTPRAEGTLFYIPAGVAGMLVYFGGVERGSNGSYIGVDMDTIYVFDIANFKWFRQTASAVNDTSEIPASRRRYCGGVSWPEDRSSFNFYLFGGLAAPETGVVGYSDVWILSIPSFTWTKMFTGEPGSIKHSLSCNIVNKGQMIIQGGFWPNSSIHDCDLPPIWGQHNLNLGSNDTLKRPWWEYLPNITDYSVGPELTQVIGGSSSGAATLKSPKNGWDDENVPGLDLYLGAQLAAAPQGLRKPKRKSLHDAGPIAGGVVGGVAGLALIIALAWLCLRLKRRPKNTPAVDVHLSQAAAHKDQARYASGHKHNLSATSNPVSSGAWAHTPAGSPRTPQQPQTYWVPLPSHSQSPQYPQQYFPPPPQAQQYYPPPPQPEHYDPPSPIFEMPNVRSPHQVGR